MKMENVGLLSMSAEQYHGNKEAVGHSGLVKLMRSPAHYQEYVTNPPEPTPAMAFGTALHMAALEPAEFASVYAVFDESRLDGTLQSLDDYKSAAEALGIKVGKMKKDEIKDAIKVADVESHFVFREDAIARLYGGKQILQPTAMLAIQSIQASISRHTGAARLLSTGLAEMSGFWMDSETGIPCKCRPDWLVMAGEMTTGIVDVKSCCDASAEGFARVIATMGYDLQAAYYQDGIKALTGRTLENFWLLRCPVRAAVVSVAHNIRRLDFRNDIVKLDAGHEQPTTLLQFAATTSDFGFCLSKGFGLPSCLGCQIKDWLANLMEVVRKRLNRIGQHASHPD